MKTLSWVGRTLAAAYLCCAIYPVAASEHFNGARLDAYVPNLITEERIAGVGIAVIRNGKLAWSGYYGKQGPGVPVTDKTVFNTGSVAKSIAAETFIALAGKGLIDLDERIAEYVTHPDLATDPRFELLTPRMLVSHRAGLLNWAYAYPDGKLAFDHDPDIRFSYSGAGMELAARYAEAKTGKSLQELAFEHVLDPLGIKEMSLGSIADWTEGRLATPMNADGKYGTLPNLAPSLYYGSGNSAADDLLVTVPAYAKLIEGMLAGGPGADFKAKARATVITSQAEDPVYRCADYEGLICPHSFGHSIGWQAYHYDDHLVIKHSGSDAGENAFVYFSPDTRSGAVIFVNGANGWVVMARIIELIGDEPQIATYYRGLIQSVMGRDMPPLELADP